MSKDLTCRMSLGNGKKTLEPKKDEIRGKEKEQHRVAKKYEGHLEKARDRSLARN